MKTSILAGLAGLAFIATAVPTENLRRTDNIARQVNSPPYPNPAGAANFPPFPHPTFHPTGVSPPFSPTGFAPAVPRPTGSVLRPPYPMGPFGKGSLPSKPFPTGSSGTGKCSTDGALVCNGPNLFGICNFGSVFWQPVADGTACEDARIVGTGIYAHPAPTGTGYSLYYYSTATPSSASYFRA